ncbi:MAG: DUF2505 domain-containing protein [Propionibacteriaceae bacterium]|nr:DUF2505 domain-containing protein [Propionibacteriaceae bacterium]
MQITSSLTYIAPCDPVAKMLINPDFAKYLGTKLDAQKVTTELVDGGLQATLTVASPEGVGMFLGPTMDIIETLTWEPAAEDGSRTGRMIFALSGLPAALDGPLILHPTPTGCVIDYDAVFTVSIPIFGKKLEEMAESYLSKLVKSSEVLGNKWLAEHDLA